MKLSILALVTALSFSAFAQQKDKPFLNCTVPMEGGTSPVKLTLTLTSDTSADFIKAILVDGQTTLNFFSQLKKDEALAQLTSGSMGLVLVSETSRQENGVVRNAGFMGIAKRDNAFSGLLSAQGSLYPLQCTAAQ